jgi:hypothetical protein
VRRHHSSPEPHRRSRLPAGSSPTFLPRTPGASYVYLEEIDSTHTDSNLSDLWAVKSRPVTVTCASGSDLAVCHDQPCRFACYQILVWLVDGRNAGPRSRLVCRKGAPRDGSSLFLLYGYGSYEISADPGFSIPRLSLPPHQMNLNDFVKPPGRLVVAVRW